MKRGKLRQIYLHKTKNQWKKRNWFKNNSYIWTLNHF